MFNRHRNLLFVLIVWGFLCSTLVGCNSSSPGSGASTYPAATGNTYDSSTEARMESLRQGQREIEAEHRRKMAEIDAAEAAARARDRERQADSYRNGFR